MRFLSSVGVATFAGSFVLAMFACKSDGGDSSSSSSGGTSSSGGSSGDESSSGSSGSQSSSGTSGAQTSSGTSGDPPKYVPSVDITSETMEFDGKTRHYLIGKPKTYDATKKYPVVFNFHGNPGDAQGQANAFPFDAASKNDAVLVYPDGEGNNWDQYAANNENADMNWIAALPDEVATKISIDKTKMFAFGYSGGGIFVSQFTCRFKLFKAVSVNAGDAPYEETIGGEQRPSGCYVCPAGPIATIITHGTKDNVVPPDLQNPGGCQSETNGCDGNPATTPVTPDPCKKANGCPAAYPVTACMVDGFGHGLWSQAITVSWAFFSSLP